MKRPVFYWTGGVALFCIVEGWLFLSADLPFSIFMKNWLENHRSCESMLRIFTEMGQGLYILLPIGIATLLCFGFYKKNQRAKWKNASLDFFFIFSAVAIAGIANNIIKFIIGRARPKLEETVGNDAFNPLTFQHDWNSFPSGHSTNIFALATALAILFPAFRWPLFIVASLVALSRAILNAHYLSDVVAGSLLGLGMPFLVFSVFNRFFIREKAS